MKKITILLAAVAAFGFASCNKDYACTCTSSTAYSNGSADADPPSITTIKDTRKSRAKTLCQDTERTGSSSFGGTSVTYTVTNDCTLSKK